MRRAHLAVTFAAVLLLSGGAGGCAYLSTHLGGFVQSQSTATEQEANDLGTAERLGKAFFQAADVYVTVAKPDQSTLKELDSIRVRVHDELINLRAAHSRGESLKLQAFNDALKAWFEFKQKHGVKNG